MQISRMLTDGWIDGREDHATFSFAHLQNHIKMVIFVLRMDLPVTQTWYPFSYFTEGAASVAMFENSAVVINSVLSNKDYQYAKKVQD